MKLKEDKNGHLYAEVENIRITYIPAKDRSSDADWAGADVIRVQSYRGYDDKTLHRGAELPVSSHEIFASFVAAICQVYVEAQLKE